MSGDRGDDWCALEELAVGWAMHALEPDEEAVLRAHLPDCERCQRATRSTEEVTAALGGSVRQYEPPARLKARLMAAIEDTPQEPAVPKSAAVPRQEVAEPISLEARRPRAVGRGRVLLGAAAVILVAVLAGAVGQRFAALSDQVAAQSVRTGQMESALRLAADPRTNRAVLETKTGEPSAVLLSGDNDAAVLPMKLAPNDTAKQIYVVWGTSGKRPVPLATFDVQPGSPEISLLAWSKAAHAHNGFAISLEPGRIAPDGPSTVVAAGQVATT